MSTHNPTHNPKEELEVKSLTRQELLKLFAALKNKSGNCTKCTNCTDCTDCNHCYYCISCISCNYCNNCYYCFNCISCNDCNNCYNCYDCNNCYSCNNCNNCILCKKLSNVRTGYWVLNKQVTYAEFKSVREELKK